MQLLIVPIILVAIGLAFNAREQNHQDAQLREDRAQAETAREDATLDAYYSTMSKLILDRNLLHAKSGSAVRQVARTETLATVRRLDGSRKAEVVHFLDEAGLLVVGQGREVPIVDLAGADLRGTDFTHANLNDKPGTDYSLVLTGDLRGARFDNALLTSVDFVNADLRGASFDNADLNFPTFDNANLQDASFKHASLVNVSFLKDELARTAFDGAWFGGRADFRLACLSGASFAGASFSQGRGVFYGARGHDIDFSGARGLSKVRFGGRLQRVRFGDATQRPKTIPWQETEIVNITAPAACH